MAKKTENLGLPITDDPNLRFAEWWRLINGEETLDHKPSAFQIIDKKIGEIGDGVKIKEEIQGGWKGTTVPDSGYIENVYFNTNLSFTDVISLFNNLTTAVFENRDTYPVLITDNSTQTLQEGILFYNDNNFGITIMCNKKTSDTTYSTIPIFVEDKNDVLNIKGWTFGNTELNPLTENFMTFNSNAITNTILSQFSLENQNGILSNLFSITPFEQEAGQQGGLYIKDNIAVAANVDTNEELEKMQNLQIGDKVFKMGDGEYTNTSPTTSAVGGIPKGTTFEKKTIQEVLDMLLYPYVKFSCSFSTSPNGGVFEKGQEVTVTSGTVNVTLGSVPIEKIEIYDGSTLITSVNNVVDTNTFTLSQTVYTNKSFSAKVTDAKGETSTVNSGTFTFVDPYYVGVVSPSATINSTLIKSLTKKIETKGNKTYEISMDQQKAVIAYPSDYGSLTKIYDVNNFDVTETFEKTTLQVNNTNYNVYVLSVPATSTMTYKFNY